MIELSDADLTVHINEHGAEVTSVVDADGLEYMWQADKKFWGRHAPILFPVVGRLKDDQYEYQGQTYSMGQHGFARDSGFTVVEQSESEVSLRLTDNEQTRAIYPFEFELLVTYKLEQHKLRVAYQVTNDGQQPLLFSIGAHPGFNVPLVRGEADFNDYVVRVAPAKTYQQIPLRAPLSDPTAAQPINLRQPLPLTHQLFEDDAVVLELEGQETTVMLETAQNDHGVALTVKGASYLGIWSPFPQEAPFVCLEPWWGLADTVDSDGQLANKFAMNRLAIQKQFVAQYDLTFF